MLEDAPVEGTPLIAPSNTDHPLYDNIVDGIRTVYDPEIPVNIFDLGLIYTVEINAESEVRVLMTLTAPGCPVAGEMPGWVAEAIEPLPGVKHVEVELVWEPPWGMDMMSDEARLNWVSCKLPILTLPLHLATHTLRLKAEQKGSGYVWHSR